MEKIIKSTALIIALMCVMLFSACGGDSKGLPVKIKTTKSVIDYSDPLEDGMARIDVTLFDSYGNPMKDGTMYFTLSDRSAGGLQDPDGTEKTKAVSVGISDGVAEVFFYAGKKNETVVITAHVPGYPKNTTASVTIRVINGTSFWVSSDKTSIDLSTSTDYKANITAYVFTDDGSSANSGNVTLTIDPGSKSYFKENDGTRTDSVFARVSNGSATAVLYAANVNESVTVKASYPGRTDESTTIEIFNFENTVDFNVSVDNSLKATFTDKSLSGPTPDDKIVEWTWEIFDESNTLINRHVLNKNALLTVNLKDYNGTTCSAMLSVERENGDIHNTGMKSFLVSDGTTTTPVVNTADFNVSVKKEGTRIIATFTDTSISGPDSAYDIVNWRWEVCDKDGNAIDELEVNIYESYKVDLTAYNNMVCSATLKIDRRDGTVQTSSQKKFLVTDGTVTTPDANTADFTTSVKKTGDNYVVTLADTSTSGVNLDDKIVKWIWEIFDKNDVTIEKFTLSNGNDINFDLTSYKGTTCSTTLTIERRSGVLQKMTKYFLVVDTYVPQIANTADFNVVVKKTGTDFIATFTDTSVTGSEFEGKIIEWNWKIFDKDGTQIDELKLNFGDPLKVNLTVYENTICSAELTVKRGKVKEDGSVDLATITQQTSAQKSFLVEEVRTP